MNETLKWSIGLCISIVIAGATLYAHWINDSVETGQKVANDLVRIQHDTQQNLDILNAKVDLILQLNKINYNGPKYRSIEK
jgi:hypothetical protein